MIYRPQQKLGRGKSSEGGEKPRAGTEYNDSPEGFWARKQVPNVNRVMGDADLPLAGPDRDCDAEDNFSYGKGGYERPHNDPHRGGGGLDSLHREAASKHASGVDKKEVPQAGPRGGKPSSSTIWDEEPWKEKG